MNEPYERALVNGQVFHVIAEGPLGPLGQANDPRVKRLVILRRPNGSKEYTAKDFGPHPIYGDNRRYVMVAKS